MLFVFNMPGNKMKLYPQNLYFSPIYLPHLVSQTIGNNK